MLSNPLINRLQIMQNNCIRSIVCKKVTENVSKDSIRLRILSVRDLIKLHIGKFMYNYENSKLPVGLNNVFTSNTRHCYETRNKNTQHYLIKSLFTEGPDLWKTIPNVIKLSKGTSSSIKITKISF